MPSIKRKEVDEFMKKISWCIIVAMLVISIVPRVEAGFAPSEMTALSRADMSSDLKRIQKVLETKMIKERLGQLGFKPDEISSRFAQLSNRQIHQLALQLDDLKVGGDGLGVVIAMLVIAILVVLLLQLTGHKIIVQ